MMNNLKESNYLNQNLSEKQPFPEVLESSTNKVKKELFKSNCI